jgi:hypothetical protein
MTDLQTSDFRSSDPRSLFHGLWLPLITPFRDHKLDEASLRRLVRHYSAFPVNGLILAATTGESLTLTPKETQRLVFAVRDELARESFRFALACPAATPPRYWRRWGQPRRGRSTPI